MFPCTYSWQGTGSLEGNSTVAMSSRPCTGPAAKSASKSRTESKSSISSGDDSVSRIE